MKIERSLKRSIIQRLRDKKNKIIVLYGARQTGKTTLANDVSKELSLKTLYINADKQKYIDILSSKDETRFKGLVGDYQFLVIDEAQRIPEVGLNLKILHESFEGLRILVTGSSSIDIASKVSEALTGRKYVFSLFPIALSELRNHFTLFEIDEKIDDILVHGSYPEVFTEESYQEKAILLEEIGNSYLYKDIFELTGIRNKNKLIDLLRLLAFQIGSEVSIHELSKKLLISRDAVNQYIDLLEQAFVIFRLSGFSRNLRKEISKMDKYYFFDNGIRNMLINNFNALPYRNDVGQLWENFVIAERMKYLSYRQKPVNRYFWRVYTGGEVDYLEEDSGELRGYEIKHQTGKAKPPKTWLETYPNSKFQVINRNNYHEFLV